MNQFQVNKTSRSVHSELVANSHVNDTIILESTLLDEVSLEKRNGLVVTTDTGKNISFSGREKTMFNDIWYT